MPLVKFGQNLNMNKSFYSSRVGEDALRLQYSYMHWNFHSCCWRTRFTQVQPQGSRTPIYVMWMFSLFCVVVKIIKGFKYNSFTLQEIEWNGFKIVSVKISLFEEQSKILIKLKYIYTLISKLAQTPDCFFVIFGILFVSFFCVFLYTFYIFVEFSSV